MNTVFIYALCEPDTGEVRYVGKAKDPKKRLSTHLAGKSQCHRTNWISSLRAKGLKPSLEILDEVSENDWQQWEVAWIEFFKDQGFNLVNTTLGGEGLHNPSEEVRSKMSVSNFGKKRTLETCAKIRAANIGRKHSVETCAKISAAHKNMSADARARMRATMRIGHLGMKRSPESVARSSAAHRGMKRSDEARANMSAAMKRNYEKKKEKEMSHSVLTP